MGSSNRKKKEKQKDFQKPKFKVGKDKPKASNFTDTSFKSKAIAMGQQSLSTTAPDVIQQFKHNLSLASSKSDKQRREALAYLTSQLSSHPPVKPVPTGTILSKLLPLISDNSKPVRSQLLLLFRTLPAAEVKHSIEQAIMHIRAGMTHLSADISSDSLGFLDWLLDAAGDELVACPGGWVRTLNSMFVMTGWSLSSSKSGWSSGSKSGVRAKDAQAYTRQITAFSHFLNLGLQPEAAVSENPNAFWDSIYRSPRRPNAFAYLNLYGAPRDEEGEMYTSREDRQRVFHRRFIDAILKGVDQAKKEGGTVGRAAAILHQSIQEGMSDYDSSAGEEQW